MLHNFWVLDHLSVVCDWIDVQGGIPCWRQQALGCLNWPVPLTRRGWISLLSCSKKGSPKRCFGLWTFLAARMLGVHLPGSPNNWPSNTDIWTTVRKGEAGEHPLAPSHFFLRLPILLSGIHFKGFQSAFGLNFYLAALESHVCFLPCLEKERFRERDEWNVTT